MLPIQQNIACTTEAESAKLKKIKRHRTELESVFQQIRNNGGLHADSNYVTLDSMSRQSLQPRPVSATSTASLWSSNGSVSGGIASVSDTSSVASSNKDKKIRKRDIARKLSEKVLAIFSPKTPSPGLNSPPRPTGSSSDDKGGLSSLLSKSQSVNSMSLSMPKTDSVGSSLCDMEHAGMHPLHGMLRTLSGTQITSISSSADECYNHLTGVTPREGSESEHSTDDPEIQAIRCTRDCIKELKVSCGSAETVKTFSYPCCARRH
jgi:hypothetical protein